MTLTSFSRKSMMLVMMFFFLLLPPIICSAEDVTCKTAENKISKLTKIISSKLNELDSKKLKLAEVVIEIYGGNDSAALKNKKVTLIEDCLKLNRQISNHNTQKESLATFLKEKCE